MPELRVNDKDNIVELAVVMGKGTCPDIVEYYGCLIREVWLEWGVWLAECYNVIHRGKIPGILPTTLGKICKQMCCSIECVLGLCFCVDVPVPLYFVE